MTMQEKLLKAFVEAYYHEDDSIYAYDRHELFSKLLRVEFDVDVNRQQAVNIAESIAANGVTICKSGDKVLEVLG